MTINFNYHFFIKLVLLKLHFFQEDTYKRRKAFKVTFQRQGLENIISIFYNLMYNESRLGLLSVKLN